jgi:hypothetical protein
MHWESLNPSPQHYPKGGIVVYDNAYEDSARSRIASTFPPIRIESASLMPPRSLPGAASCGSTAGRGAAYRLTRNSCRRTPARS